VLSSSTKDRIREFRAKANELREKSMGMPESDMRQEFLGLARQYDVLADGMVA
jgi:hypothetical protein